MKASWCEGIFDMQLFSQCEARKMFKADPSLRYAAMFQSQYTDTGPAIPSTDPITPGAGQGSHLLTYVHRSWWSIGHLRPLTIALCSGLLWLFQTRECQFLSHWYDSTPEKSRRKRDSNPGSSALEADDALTTRPTRRCPND